MGSKATMKTIPSQHNVKHQAKSMSDFLNRFFGTDGTSHNLDFYISALTETNPYNTVEEIKEWLRSLNQQEYFSVTRKPLTQLKKWSYNDITGDLEHESGKFFGIRGLSVKTNMTHVNSWTQPTIDQPEIGLLGIISKKIDGILYFLMQAKAEPGNINTFQLSPTVQATRSNFTRVHGGKGIPYIEYFFDVDKATVLVDQLQSEQGARFFKKRNRNIIIRVKDNEKIESLPSFKWLTLGQINRLLQEHNTINMDSRSVISCISYGLQCRTGQSVMNKESLKRCVESLPLISRPISQFAIDLIVSGQPYSNAIHSYESIVHRLTALKFSAFLDAKLVPLKEVKNWLITPDEIYHEEKKYFSIFGVSIKANNREVIEWDQPIVAQHSPGIVGFITSHVGGILHFLVQVKMECGNMDLLELAPTVQCITDNYDPKALPPYAEYILYPEKYGLEIIIDTNQSEEGGRFYRESNRNMIVFGNFEQFNVEKQSPYIWMTFFQIKEFIRYNNYLNVEARSLLSCLRMT